MTLAHALSAYLMLNILIVIGCLNLLVYPLIAAFFKRTIRAKSLLNLHYSALLIILIFIVLHPFLPGKNIFMPAAKVWSAQSIKTFSKDYSKPDESGYLSLPGFAGDNSLNADKIKIALIIIESLLLAFGIGKIAYDLYRLFLIRKTSFLIRRKGTVSIFANDQINVPFSYWTPGQANIIIPTKLLGKKADFKMILFHEFEHHRHGDTKIVYVMWLLRSICFFNPFVHLWNSLISEIQEFACDETLVDQKKIDSQAYTRCLIEAATSALDQKHVPVCATGLTFMAGRKLLKRRIEKMHIKVPRQFKWQINFLVIILMTAMMAAIAFASKGLVQDRRITEAQALKMAERAGLNSDFPVVVNDRVLKQLNSYLGTPEGREFMKNAIERMKKYQAGIEAKLDQYGVPKEFLAIPIIESGYQNLEQPANKERGAGIWMFIGPTARNYGLTVNATTDERLDTDLLTDAAMRYLSANKLRFNDWQLSVLAYNIGESKVQEAIDLTGSRDVWSLIRAGYENDNDYYASFMAAIIIMRNPDSID